MFFQNNGFYLDIFAALIAWTFTLMPDPTLHFSNFKFYVNCVCFISIIVVLKEPDSPWFFAPQHDRLKRWLRFSFPASSPSSRWGDWIKNPSPLGLGLSLGKHQPFGLRRFSQPNTCLLAMVFPSHWIPAAMLPRLSGLSTGSVNVAVNPWVINIGESLDVLLSTINVKHFR